MGIYVKKHESVKTEERRYEAEIIAHVGYGNEWKHDCRITGWGKTEKEAIVNLIKACDSAKIEIRNNITFND